MGLLRRCSERSTNCRVPLRNGQLEYTRKDKVAGKESVIDHAIMSDTVADQVLTTRVDPTDLGVDHRMVLMEMAGTRRIPESKRVKVIKWKRSKLTKRSNKAVDVNAAGEARKHFQEAVRETMVGFDPEATEASKEGQTRC